MGATSSSCGDTAAAAAAASAEGSSIAACVPDYSASEADRAAERVAGGGKVSASIGTPSTKGCALTASSA